MYPFKGAFCGTLGVLAAVGVVYAGVRAILLATELAHVARYEFRNVDSTTVH